MTLTPTYITELKLSRAFRDFSTPLSDCLQTTAKKEAYISDNAQTKISEFVDANSKEHQLGKTLIVENSQQIEYSLLQIDHKLVLRKGKRCDCAVINNIVFNFVEFKSNVQGYKQKDINAAYISAMKQLSVTINLFRTKLFAEHIDLDKQRKIGAYMCTHPHFPHALATEMNYALQFKLSNNCPLYFANKMTI